MSTLRKLSILMILLLTVSVVNNHQNLALSSLVDNPFYPLKLLNSINPKNYTHTNKIDINSNNDFINYDFPGSGSVNDPYLISNFYIDIPQYAPYPESAISIVGVTVYFKITNCYLIGGYSNIYLENIRDGTARIENNFCFNARNSGIFFLKTNKHKIVNNTISYSHHSGIFIGEGWDFDILNNTCVQGYSGINLQDSTRNEINYNLCSNNEYAGIHITDGYPFSAPLENGTIIGNNCFNNAVGIRSDVEDCIKLVITDNVLVKNHLYGIRLNEVTNALITNNTIQQNGYGISMQVASYCNISENLIMDNFDYGIYITIQEPPAQRYHRIYHNFFYKNKDSNHSQAFDGSLDTLWFDEILNEGNIWNNWDNISSYSIDADNGFEVYDPFPLETIDSDSDGLADWWENKYSLDANLNDSFIDSDTDLLTNIEEFELGTNPIKKDTDCDHFLDGVEAKTVFT
ncbi:MAG: NosD domain-containing protein, partial [Candidatus Heimdallarchaeaceae archaeon]